ncbi:helix-turn-helix domain-containing protein [Lacrimispora sp.]|jgi:DNA-binding CsgD family transcriptional regulator|uniref:helix-turn-helix domain-containing protein n=1 Tax=Lacrimispora sp. TaxID=2719234 RepID=UPI0028B158DA|nr:helix-turn-helix transcriptional regulator [Lacrimispora sp.]
MKLILYLYDNTLLILYFGVCLLAFCRYLSERCGISAWLSALYFFLFANQLVVSMAEFIPEFTRIYQDAYISMPIWSTVISISVSICLLKLSCLLNHTLKVPFSESIALYPFIFLLLVVPTLKSSKGALFIYNSLFPIFLLYRSFSFHALANKTGTAQKEKPLSVFHPIVFQAFIIFSLSGILETFIRIFAFPTYGMISFSRILSIDFLFAATALIYICFFLQKTAALHACKTAVNFQESDLGVETSPNDEPAFYYSFCNSYHLTLREQTILTELLNHATDKQISAKLLISAFTVRSHVHNLLKKTGTKSRQELCVLYENSKKQNSG